MTGCADSDDDASPEPAPTPAPPLNGPQIANLGDGTIGRLSESLAAHRHPGEVLHLFGEAWMVCSCGVRINIPVVDHKFSNEGASRLFEAHQVTALAAVVREHTERALAEVEQRIEAWIRHGEAVPADVTTYDRWIVHEELRAIVRAARQERDR